MENEPRLPLEVRLFWICFVVATVAFWSVVGVEISRFVNNGHQAPAEVALKQPVEGRSVAAITGPTVSVP
jgi:hypothetical protein